jgi:hypothetical protein
VKGARAWVLSVAAILVVGATTGVAAAVAARPAGEAAVARTACFAAASHPFGPSIPVRFSDVVAVDGSRTTAVWAAVRGWEAHASLAEQLSVSEAMGMFVAPRTMHFQSGIHVVAGLMGELFGPRKAYVLCVVGLVGDRVVRGPMVAYTTPQ